MTNIDGLSDDERASLRSFFTNVERPVFALRLPQEVAGALFSRYSRSAKPLRRVFLEEFLGEGAVASNPQQDPGHALARARSFYDRVLVGYGDDSVAQLGGAHVACEGISNVAAKLLQDARIGVAFLEKSTRYVRFDQRDENGDWLFHREERILASRHAGEYLGLMDRLFATYARQIDTMTAVIKERLPIESAAIRHPRTGEPLSWNEARRDPALEKTARNAYAATVRAHACDVMRSLLPAATRTNVGVFATGQAWELLLTKLASQPLAEGRALAASLRRELDGVIPSFVKRAGASPYLEELRRTERETARTLDAPAPRDNPSVSLLSWDENAGEKVAASLLYTSSGAPLAALREKASALGAEGRQALFERFAAVRRNRRDRPPRALEEASYAFDIVTNIGAYRDLQRHRILTQERQLFTTALGFDMPGEIAEAGWGDEFVSCMSQAAELHDALAGEMPDEAQYVVPFAFKVRFRMTMNLREAIHFCELRTMPQGHPDYRRVAQEMWQAIAGVHPDLALFGRFVNMEGVVLGRLGSELRSEFKREQLVRKD